MGFRQVERLQQPEEEIKEGQQPDTVDLSGAEDTEIIKKQEEDFVIGKPLKERGVRMNVKTEAGKNIESFEEVMEAALPSGEYGKLALQLGEFKTLWAEGEEEGAIKLAQKMSGKKIRSAEEAKEIYKKKLGLYKIAEKIIDSKKIKQQIAKIIKDVKEAGEYEKDGKIIKLKTGQKINGRLILDKKGEYHFEIAGKYFDIKKGNKMQGKKGKKPLPADALVVPPPLPEQSKPEGQISDVFQVHTLYTPEVSGELPQQEQQEPPALPEQPPALSKQPEQTEEEPPPLPVVEQGQNSEAVEKPPELPQDLPRQEQELPDDTREREWGNTITPPAEVKAEETAEGKIESDIQSLRFEKHRGGTVDVLKASQPETPASKEGFELHEQVEEFGLMIGLIKSGLESSKKALAKTLGEDPSELTKEKFEHLTEENKKWIALNIRLQKIIEAAEAGDFTGVIDQGCEKIENKISIIEREISSGEQLPKADLLDKINLEFISDMIKRAEYSKAMEDPSGGGLTEERKKLFTKYLEFFEKMEVDDASQTELVSELRAKLGLPFVPVPKRVEGQSLTKETQSQIPVTAEKKKQWWRFWKKQK